MVILICKVCNKKFNTDRFKQYCSRKCNQKDYYIKNKPAIIEKVKKWCKDNPERRNELAKKANKKYREKDRKHFQKMVMKNYYKNTGIWQSRNLTYRILNGNGGCTKYHDIDKKCKFCSSITNLEIHHEEYPTKTKDVIVSIKNGKIYYLCRKCHGRIRRLINPKK